MMQTKVFFALGTLFVLALFVYPSNARAGIAGYPVVLVNGFQPSQLTQCPDTAQQRNDGYAYWSAFWDQHANARLDWSSCSRVETGIAQELWPQLRNISVSGLCQNGCVFVTHSTGDLVTRYLLANQAHWLTVAGLQPIKVIAVLDFGGAGGGDSLASLAIQVANNNAWYLDPIKAAIKAWLGYDIYGSRHLGVLNDLTPGMARSIATVPSMIPHLRFVGGGYEYLGVTKPFLPGRDDSVVALQSSCGAAQFGSYDSCVSWETMGGKQTGTSAPSALWYNYYPVLMGDDTNHSGLIGKQTGVRLAPVDNRFVIGQLGVDFSTASRVDKPWWAFWSSGTTYVYVPGSESRSMSQTVYNTLNH